MAIVGVDAERVGGGEDVWGDDFIEQALEFAIRQVDPVECLEFLTEILLQRGTIANLGAVLVLQAPKFLDELFFKLAFGSSHCIRYMSFCKFSTRKQIGPAARPMLAELASVPFVAFCFDRFSSRLTFHGMGLHVTFDVVKKIL